MNFINNIHINKLFHLSDFDIPVADEKFPHLIITGKNGSGKTILLNAVSDFLNKIKDDKAMLFLGYYKSLETYNKILKETTDEQVRRQTQQNVDFFSREIENIYGKVGLRSELWGSIIDKYAKGEFIIAFYQADRKVKMSEPKNPMKPVINKKGNVRETATSQFLNFLSDLKIQEALARNEKQDEDADEINAWFRDFEELLRHIYQDDELRLEFNYRDYSFRICTEGKKFKFTEVSDGFAAVLDIVADLILKMQGEGTLIRSYQKEGIVLIDEIETHLHLALQKVIMPLLTKVFPNIQFVITTHSPFVLSSMPDAVAYDLEHREVLENLTEYSYESLAEGYFGVRTQSSYAEMQLDNFRRLLAKEELSDAEKVEIKQMKCEFEKITETLSPLIVGEFRQIVIQNAEKLSSL
ncbi:MAG: AAA family ATPase [Prevotella sp.]|nr:AAA family ATPase [Prevotella sp.]